MMVDTVQPESEPSRIDPKALERWSEIPVDAFLNIPMHRGQMDLLFIGLREMIIAQSFILTALSHMSSGDIKAASEDHRSAFMHNDAAFSKLNDFISIVMRTAQKEDGHDS